LSASHVAYGLRLTANLPIPSLPLCTHVQTTDVQIWLGDRLRSPIQNDNYLEFVYSSPDYLGPELRGLRVAMDPIGGYFAFFYRDGARFAVERHGREVWADWPEDYTLEDACTYLLGSIMGFVLRLRGITCLHASAIAAGDYAIAFAGSPGAGKSTLAAALAQRGFPVLSDDIVALTEEEADFYVRPGYPRLNLWPDSVRSLFGDENALPPITPTWDKRYLALDQDGRNFARQSLPLRAIYFLDAREAGLSEPVIEEVVDRQAFMALLANTHGNYLLDRGMRTREFNLLGRVAVTIPMRRVRCSANLSAFTSLCETIIADASRLNMVTDPSESIHCR
jgi:hypothetical protein